MNLESSKARRRARGLAKAKATNDLYAAIANDPLKRWASGADYAKRRLRVLPSSLSGYCNGTTAAPRHVDDKVRTDFPGLSWTWPRGVSD